MMSSPFRRLPIRPKWAAENVTNWTKRLNCKPVHITVFSINDALLIDWTGYRNNFLTRSVKENAIWKVINYPQTRSICNTFSWHMSYYKMEHVFVCSVTTVQCLTVFHVSLQGCGSQKTHFVQILFFNKTWENKKNALTSSFELWRFI